MQMLRFVLLSCSQHVHLISVVCVQVEYVGDDATIDTQRFDFVPISRLPTLEVNAVIDVIGVVAGVGPLGQIMSQKTKKELTKRVISLIDQDGKAVDLTLWGDDAVKHNENSLQQHPVVAVKACRVSDYQGRALVFSLRELSLFSQVFR